MKKFFSLLGLILLVVSISACNKKVDSTGSVYLLNFKPEANDAFQSMAQMYKDQTGVTVKVVTAADGTYDQTLTADMLKSDQPTIFNINGPIGLQEWKDYTLPLNTLKDNGYHELTILNDLSDPSLASGVTLNNNVYGLPITVEGYGLVINKTVFSEYFAQTNKASTLSSVDQISNFDQLKTVVEDLTAYINGTKVCTNCPTIDGLDGVFTPTALESGNDWPYQTHLANIPFFWEFQEANANNPLQAGIDANTVTFKYNADFKNIFDLYTNNNAVAASSFASTDYNTAVANFATQKSAIIQQGDWVYSAITSAQGATIYRFSIRYDAYLYWTYGRKRLHNSCWD